MLYFILSCYEDIGNVFAKMQHEFEEKLDKIYIEDFLKKEKLFKESDVVYILNSSKKITEFIGLINPQTKIINKDFYLKNLNKKEVLELLFENNLSVPENIDHKNIEKSTFPVMFKSKSHVNFVAKLYTLSSYLQLINKFDINEFYLEKPVDIEEEMKVYFVDGNVCFYDGFDCNKHKVEIEKQCKKISRVLNLEVFSADFLYDGKNYFIIDVNPAAGLYKSAEARKRLINMK